MVDWAPQVGMESATLELTWNYGKKNIYIYMGFNV